jgi:hypothetical protein
MLTSLLVAFNYQYKLVFGPAFIIFLAVALAILLKYPVSKGKISRLLIAAGIIEAAATMLVAFTFGVLMAAASAFVGVLLGFYASLSSKSIIKVPKGHLSQSRTRIIKQVAYGLLIAVIAASSLIIAVRATGGVREDYLENFHGTASPNLTIQGTINSIALNYEVNNGYFYHIFPAYLTVSVTQVVNCSSPWANQTAAEYLNQQGNLVVYYERTAVPNLSVGQRVEINGYLCPWIEDSIYQEKFVVSPAVNGSYLHGL